MRQEFQRADFGFLMGDDELLDGNELSIGFVRIAADGLHSTYKATYGEKPALDMNFNPGKEVLPFPFTLEEFKAFCAWHPLFLPEIIESRFTNEDATIDNEALAELDDRSRLAGTLVRSILGVLVEAEAAVALDEPAKTGPAPATDTAITAPVAVVASVEPAETKPVNRGWVMKKAALIKKNVHQWPTITGDFHSSSENDLSKVAKAPGHGDWFEDDAINWARQRGKLTEANQQAPANSIFSITGKKHTIEG